MSQALINGVAFAPGLITIIRSNSTDAGRKFAQAFVDAGAQIVISPHTSEEVIKATKNSGLVSVPGVATLTEIADALRYEGDILKFFPASSLVLNSPKSVRDPFPGNTWMATGGIALADEDA